MRKRTLVFAASFIIIAFFGALMAHSHFVRIPASAPVNGKLIPQEASKHLQVIKVEIAKPDHIPDFGDDEVTLTGRITLNNSAAGEVSYLWTLPEDVEAVEGELSDSFADVQPGQTVEVKLVVTGFTKEKQLLISLQGSVSIAGKDLGSSTVISSRPEDTWESAAPKMQKAAEETLGKEAFRPHSK